MATARGPRDTSAPAGRRIRIALLCSVCGNRNYQTSKTPREGVTIQRSKFCSNCNQHTVHIEGK